MNTPATRKGTQNHGVCLTEQASPSAMGPAHRAIPASRPAPKRSHRQRAITRKGRYPASVPPDAKMSAKTGVTSSRAPTQRIDAGSSTNTNTPVTNQAVRSTQSVISWRAPSSTAGISSRNDPAG